MTLQLILLSVLPFLVIRLFTSFRGLGVLAEVLKARFFIGPCFL